MEGQKVLANNRYDKGLVFKVYKEPLTTQQQKDK